MKLYNKSSSNKLNVLNENLFKLERDIQRMFEENLETIMHLTLVKSEFTIKNKRIDTLAYDTQSNAFIIIEYKRDRNLSVVDQGFTYLSLMLENKADFIVEYNESLKKNLKRDDIDWTQTRVAFVSTAFTDNQILATNFKDIAIELWEVKQFDNNIISVNPIKKTRAAESIKPLTQQNQTLKKVNDEIKIYTENEHIARASDEIAELYVKFRDAIINLVDGIDVKPLKFYIAFKKDTNIVDIQVLKNSLKIFINCKFGKLDDAKGIARDVRLVGHSGNGDYQIQVDNDKDIEYIMSLIKQVVVK
jgi:predicted transport protein